MLKPMPIAEFLKLFPNDEACLDYLFSVRYGDEFECPKCGEEGLFKKLSNMPAYTCSCGHHVHPMVGTPFYKSHTPLQKWFYTMYLFTTTRHGVPAKELQRQLAVNYKTAWRMGHQIRKYLALVDGDPPIGGHTEIDEAMIGGVRKGKRGRAAEGKTVVLGMVERGGDIITRIVPDVRRTTLERHIIRHVDLGAAISTDELNFYKRLKMYGYKHGSVIHKAEEFVRGKHHTNTIEGFWSLIKRSIRGTHVHVSAQHLPKYLGEFEFRWNLRHRPDQMFPCLLRRLATSQSRA
ncbi:MAG: IS1595 family transposase [Hyphomicrobium sp.]|nr:IS1595 family transposase [Hyphomicrobium sp.]